MLLYHDANGDEEYYNRRAYLSVPLDKYADAENPGQKITLYILILNEVIKIIHVHRLEISFLLTREKRREK